MKLEQLHADPANPRKSLTVDELAESIKETGLLSPLLVRRIGNNVFRIISGHRRKAALELLGETYADCDIVDMTDEQAYKALMTANIQAHSLSEIEEAEGIKHMMESFEWTQDRVAKEFGKSQVWVNRRLDLLNLQPEIQEQIITRVITATHGRELGQLPVDKQPEAIKKVVEEKLSTRETAELVKQITAPINEVSAERKIALNEPVPRNDDQLIHRELPDSSTAFEIHTQIDEPKPEERRLYSDPDMRRISEMNGFILKLKDIALDLQPHESIMDDLVEYSRSNEALYELDKIVNRVEWMRKHITNAKARQDGTATEGQVLEFRRKEA